jgi:SnoaL-like domain
METRRSPELERQIAEGRAAQDRGDNEWFAAHSAGGEILMAGTAPGEIARGRAEVFAPQYSIQAMNDELASLQMRLEHGDVEAYEAGDAGFAVSEGRFAFEDGTAVPTRSVTIFARENGEWFAIGSLMSVIAPNELLAPGSPLAVGDPAAAHH